MILFLKGVKLMVDDFNVSSPLPCDDSELNETERLYRAQIRLMNRNVLQYDNLYDKSYYETVYENRVKVDEFLAVLGMKLVVSNKSRDPFISWEPIKGNRFGSLICYSDVHFNRSLFYLLLARVSHSFGKQGSGVNVNYFDEADLFAEFQVRVPKTGNLNKLKKDFHNLVKNAVKDRFLVPIDDVPGRYRIHSYFDYFFNLEKFEEYKDRLDDYIEGRELPGVATDDEEQEADDVE